jgi:cytochrome c-type biogenesis protein CcmH
VKALRLFGFAILAALCCAAQASEPMTFDDPAQEERFRELTTELRCLVCQNQTLSDSDALLAQDLRREIHGMIVAGRTDAEIKEFMVARYGDFVLYRPPVQSNTLLLWAAPLILLLIGATIIVRSVRRRSALLEAQEAAANKSATRVEP